MPRLRHGAAGAAGAAGDAQLSAAPPRKPSPGKPSSGRPPGRQHGEAAGDRGRPPRPQALKRYGQNHLVDKNILGAIVAQAAVEPGDVVLEVGAAGGLLTLPLLERARVVHAFEIDGRYFGRLDELAAGHDGLRLHKGDALKSDLGALDPPPTALVANLAYNIAIPLIMTTILALPSLRRWGVMVQRELGERLFAVPSTKAYSAVSVLVQLACRREQSRPVPASAFRPRPRVESAFVTFARRDGAGEDAALAHADYVAMVALVRRAFGQRRKVLTTTLAGASRGGLSLARDDVRAALAHLGVSPAARPEELTPAQWVALARTLCWLDAMEEG